MAEYLTPEQYEKLLSDLKDGEASLLVSRNLARQFFSMSVTGTSGTSPASR